MNTRLHTQDELLVQAKRHAKITGQPLRAVMEDELHRVLSSATRRYSYHLPDLRIGDPNSADPLENYSWPEFRETIYHHLKIR